MISIWAQTMVKNDARWLWYSVGSVVNYVDKVLLWDTGSTDGTLDVIDAIVKKYPNKIIFNKIHQNTPQEFTAARQKMLDATKADWFIMLDGDEIWYDKSIKQVLQVLTSSTGKNIESVVVPTINAVGDIFHYQDDSAGMYKFGNLKGHYNLRAVKRNIPGLHSQGIHGVWGWADGDNKMIQDRQTFKFIDAPYLHATFLPRASEINFDKNVVKRRKKLKYELGKDFDLDFYYPEIFFKDKPDMILSPWKSMSFGFKIRGLIETPLRKIKRSLMPSKVGY